MTTELLRVGGTMVEDRLVDVVFVHGLDGDKRTTWQFNADDEDSFWPQLLYNDIPTCGIWSFGYEAHSSEWFHGKTMPILDRATNFAAFLASEGLGSRPLFFVTHSLGGLVVKQMLRSRFDQDRNSPLLTQTKGIFFFATPHAGSDLSKLVQWMQFYRPSVLVGELEAGAASLRDLNYWYRANCDELGIVTTVFFETRPTRGFLVVDQASSDPGIPSATLVPVDANHVEICKVGCSDMPYKLVLNGIKKAIREYTPEFELSSQSPLWMHVSCLNEYPSSWEENTIPKPEERVLRYSCRPGPDLIEFSPHMPYLDAVREGQPVWALDYMWLPFRWLPLILDLKFLNNGDDTVYLTRLDLAVRKSTANTEPVPFVKRSECFPNLTVSNDGWGEICSPTLRLAFADGVGQPSFPETFPFEILLEDFATVHELDLSEQFSSLGVDIDGVMSGEENARLGPFQSRAVFVFGELAFSTPEGEPRFFRFGNDMYMDVPPPGMYAPPNFEYETRLRVEGEDYVQSVDLSQVIGPRESDRFLLQLNVDKSSYHDLTISVVGNHGVNAVSLPVRLSLFVPRSVHERVSDTVVWRPFFI